MPQQCIGISEELVEDQNQMLEFGQGNGAMDAQCRGSFVMSYNGRY